MLQSLATRSVWNEKAHSNRFGIALDRLRDILMRTEDRRQFVFLPRLHGSQRYSSSGWILFDRWVLRVLHLLLRIANGSITPISAGTIRYLK